MTQQMMYQSTRIDSNKPLPRATFFNNRVNMRMASVHQPVRRAAYNPGELNIRPEEFQKRGLEMDMKQLLEKSVMRDMEKDSVKMQKLYKVKDNID